MPPLELKFLNARQGDAIWVRWGLGRQLLIDMGTQRTGEQLAKRFHDELAEEQRRFELLVITHVDVDHIGGVLSGLAGDGHQVPGLSFADVWFNGWEHLIDNTPPPNSSGLEALGGAQGEKLSLWLRDRPWNAAFGRRSVIRRDIAPAYECDGLSLTVLGPTQDRLEALKNDWAESVEAAIERGYLDRPVPAGLQRLGSSAAPILDDKTDLALLAETLSPTDTSMANGSSIVLLLQWEGKRILLTGDAFADSVLDGLIALEESLPVRLDLVKAPHHGSQQNMTRELSQAIACPVWVFSSDGTNYRHPDSVAIARILHYGSQIWPTLAFNTRSRYSGWWDNAEWRARYRYATRYGTNADGITIRYESGNDTPVFG